VCVAPTLPVSVAILLQTCFIAANTGHKLKTSYTIRRLIGLTLTAILASLLCIIFYLHFKDYREDFRERRGLIINAQLEPVTKDSTGAKFWLRLQNTKGMVMNCGMLVPNGENILWPAVILLGGKATGKHAVDYALGVDSVLIVAVDYPFEPRDNYTVTSFLGDVPTIRSSLLDMVPSVMLVRDYLATRDDVDTTRIVVAGYSFGAPLVPVIVATDRRFSAAVMGYGAGGLHSLIRHNIRRYRDPFVSELGGVLGGLLLRPLEPMRYIAEVSPTPLIMINGTHDDQIPHGNTLALHENAGQPKTIRWIESGHLHPRNPELTRKVANAMADELRRLGILGEVRLRQPN